MATKRKKKRRSVMIWRVESLMSAEELRVYRKYKDEMKELKSGTTKVLPPMVPEELQILRSLGVLKVRRKLMLTPELLEKFASQTN
jgi:hypothetical protein